MNDYRTGREGFESGTKQEFLNYFTPLESRGI